MKFDVAIIGAGIIGGMAARELSRYNLSVCLLENENDVAMGASRSNSGIIHGGYDPEPGTLKAKMNTEGIGLLYEAARELNVHHKNNGSLVCAFGTPEEEKTVEELYHRSFENGIDCVRLLSGDEARALEPNLSDKVSRALYVPNAGIICPYDLTIAAIGNAMDNGVALKRNFEVAKIEKIPAVIANQSEDWCGNPQRVAATEQGIATVASLPRNDGNFFTLTSAEGETVECTYLLNCAGGHSDKIAQMAGDGFFTIIPRSGEYMLLDKAEGGRVRHTIFQVPSAEGKGILVTPTVDGNLLTGPTARKVANADSTETTPEGLATIARFAAKSVPSVNFRQVITSFSGVRSSEKTGDFLIQASDKVENLVHVAAIASPGLTSCVAIAKMAVGILKDLGLGLTAKSGWNGHRENTRAFREMTEEEKDAYIKMNPAYGKIVCRCETVSEGEMREAIRRNPPAFDIDGVKRRTRGGMGRCQGGFCSPYVMKLIAQEHGLKVEEVTKSGRGSEPLTGKL